MLDLLDYDPTTGLFKWKERKQRRPQGWFAGSRHSSGYLRVTIEGNPLVAHQLAWALAHGEYAGCPLEHIDGNRANNKLDNLRPATGATSSLERRNKYTNAFTGVQWHPESCRWVASITAKGERHVLGQFVNEHDAASAYQFAREMLTRVNT